MTFSIVGREAPEDDDGTDVTRFGVAVTTNNPGIGVFCPAVSEHGGVAAQYGTHGEVGTRMLSLIDDGLRAEAVVPAVLRTVDRSSVLQVHALCRETRGVHHGSSLAEHHEESGRAFGDVSGSNYSVAGNSLADEETLEATAESFREADPSRYLADRLLEALEAGDAAGGDDREIDVRSAALRVVDPDAGMANEWYNDLRVDASPTPLAAIREQYERAKPYHEEASEEW